MSARTYGNEFNFSSIKEHIDKLLNDGNKPILISTNESMLSKTKGYYIFLSSEKYPKYSCGWKYKRSTHRNKALLKLNNYINETTTRAVE
jgi:Ni,Fe-hydrogenase III component G